jgi:signal transduction histidine kinase
LQNLASLKRIFLFAGIGLAGALACFAVWFVARNVSLEQAFGFNRNPAMLSDAPLWLSISITVVLSTATAVAIERFGARSAFAGLAAAMFVVALCSLGATFFFATDIQYLPIVLATVVSALVVQGARLWLRDRDLALQLVNSAETMNSLGESDMRSRLVSGLRLLETVLRLEEAIVFKIADDGELEPAARLRPSHSGPLDQSRNSVWRDGLHLCKKAIKEETVVAQPDGKRQGHVNVALALRHEKRVVGAILIRPSEEFEESDRSLLSAIGSQIARDLQREEAFKLFKQKKDLGMISARSFGKKFESLYVLNGLLREQTFGMETLGEVSEGLAIARLDGTLAYINPHLLTLAKLEKKQCDLFTLLERFRTDVFDEPSIAVRRVLQTGETYERELGFADRDVTYGLRIVLIKSTTGENRGEPLCLAIHVTDLTKAKEHEQLKSDMISLMSHELRTPLTSINGFAELLNAEENLPEQAKEFVTIIGNESQRLSRMINTFLAVTNLQRKDKQEVLKIPLRLDEVAREIIATLQPAAKKRRIRLVEQPALRIPPVAADKSLITQAVKNLVSNAIKYSPERTTVTVSTALEAEAVRVSVEDRGYGIPMEARDRVWEKFYRVVREGQEKDDESTGLGLSFVREVVEQHGGQVKLETEEGRGSKFSFTLPRL